MEKMLRQLRHLRNEIRLLQEKLQELENGAVSDVVSGSSQYFPFTERRFTITGLPSDSYVAKHTSRLRRQLHERICELTRLQTALMDWINSIEDSEIRQLLILRYLDGLSWQAIAQRLGTAGDGSTERKKVNRFLSRTG